MSKPVSALASRSEEPLDLNSGRQHRSLWGDATRRLAKNPGSMIGSALLIIITALSLQRPGLPTTIRLRLWPVNDYCHPAQSTGSAPTVLAEMSTHESSTVAESPCALASYRWRLRHRWVLPAASLPDISAGGATRSSCELQTSRWPSLGFCWPWSSLPYWGRASSTP